MPVVQGSRCLVKTVESIQRSKTEGDTEAETQEISNMLI